MSNVGSYILLPLDMRAQRTNSHLLLQSSYDGIISKRISQDGLMRIVIDVFNESIWTYLLTPGTTWEYSHDHFNTHPTPYHRHPSNGMSLLRRFPIMLYLAEYCSASAGLTQLPTSVMYFVSIDSHQVFVLDVLLYVSVYHIKFGYKERHNWMMGRTTLFGVLEKQRYRLTSYISLRIR